MSIHDYANRIINPAAGIARFTWNCEEYAAPHPSYTTTGKAQALNAFMQGVRTVLPDIKFGQNEGSVMVPAYMPGEIMIRGLLYVNLDSEGRFVYTVYSRFVHNRKFAEGTMDNYSTGSINLDRAISSAASAFRRVPDIVAMHATARKADRLICEKVYDKSDAVRSASEQVFGRGYSSANSLALTRYPAHRQVLTDLQDGREFTDPEFNAEVHKLYKDLLYMDEIKQKDEKGWYVAYLYHTPDGDRRIAYVKTEGQTDILSASKWGRTIGIEDEVTVCAEDEVPEFLLRKLAVLRMLEVEQYVEDVGARFAENCFYVHASD